MFRDFIQVKGTSDLRYGARASHVTPKQNGRQTMFANLFKTAL